MSCDDGDERKGGKKEKGREKKTMWSEKRSLRLKRVVLLGAHDARHAVDGKDNDDDGKQDRECDGDTRPRGVLGAVVEEQAGGTRAVLVAERQAVGLAAQQVVRHGCAVLLRAGGRLLARDRRTLLALVAAHCLLPHRAAVVQRVGSTAHALARQPVARAAHTVCALATVLVLLAHHTRVLCSCCTHPVHARACVLALLPKIPPEKTSMSECPNKVRVFEQERQTVQGLPTATEWGLTQVPALQTR